ncbi:MAG: hypothetical protein DLM58_09735 [Pseudonocardiales bacterium]|nr:MAG: hypothetical protein DLM58_09735 [Pseudonocardiales bacterium]
MSGTRPASGSGADDDIRRHRTGTKQPAIGTPPGAVVDLSAALAADLGVLSAAVHKIDGGLEPVLQSLASQLRVAVNSYVGLTITIAADGHRISFTASEPSAIVATSLSIPLAAVAGSETGSSLVLYATVPGAFVDLAADLAWVLELDPSTFVLDQHLAVPAPSNGVLGLREHATINRAIGALIERGHTPESARAELRRHAEADSGDIPAAAQRILNALSRPPPPHDS